MKALSHGLNVAAGVLAGLGLAFLPMSAYAQAAPNGAAGTNAGTGGPRSQALATPGDPGSGWVPVFQDHFAGAAGTPVNTAIWQYDTGPGYTFGTGEIETMTDSTQNVYHSGHGTLVIRALKGADGSWTSGRIQTRADYGAPAGGEMLVTASIKQPNPQNGLGYWPAFWMLGPGQWPEHGEIDILEDVNALSSASHTLHCGTYPGGVCNEPDGIGSGLLPVAGSQTHFIRYSVLIDREVPGDESIQWFVGNDKVFEVDESQVPVGVWQEAVDHGFTIIFDLAIGGGYPDGVAGEYTPTASTSSGSRLQIRDVAVFVRNPSPSS